MADKEKDIKPDAEKTIDELAKEAMAAIKFSEEKEKRKEEEALMAKQESLKEEARNRIKKKLKKLEREVEEEEKNKLDEVDTTFMVHWSNPDKKGIKYEGNYNDKYTFRINKGFLLYHLYVEDKELINESWHHNSHTSVNLYTLKEKADKILKKFISNKN